MKPSNKTLYEFFSEYASSRGEERFIFNESKSYTVGESFNIVKGLAKQFNDGGINAGVYVGVKADRTIESIFVFYALQFVGAVAVMYEPREEVTERVKIISDKLYVGDVEAALDFNGYKGGDIELTENSKDTGAIIFTSGSTGGRKAVKLSQYNFINNSLDTYVIGGYKKGDINILIIPVYHVFGLSLIMTAVVTGKYGLFVPKSVEINYVLDCMEKYNITRLNGVPSLYLALAEKKGARKLKLDCCLIGGGPCTKEQFIKIEKTLGVTLIPVYGMSECIGISVGSYTDSLEDRCDSVGRPYSMNTVKINGDGEIWVKGAAMSAGYVNGEVSDKDGWLHTGDLGKIDENGFLHILGRKKEIIIRNGNNLSALNIERKILSLPQVKDVCVVGITDENVGEVPCALVVGVKTDLSEILTKIEMPAKIIYTDKIPLTSSGKPDKQAVKKYFI